MAFNERAKILLITQGVTGELITDDTNEIIGGTNLECTIEACNIMYLRT